MHLLLLLWMSPAVAGALPVSTPPGVDSVTALYAADDGLWLGTDVGLYRHESAGWHPVLAPREIRDLAHGPDGARLIATATGLLAWPAADARPRSLSVPGTATSVARSGGTWWVASEAGLYSGSEADALERWGELSPGPIRSVRATRRAVWVAKAGALWSRRGAGPFERRIAAPEDGWWELRAAVEHDDVTWLAVPRGRWRVRADSAERVELGRGEVRDLALRGQTLLVASERGVYALGDGDGPHLLLAGSAHRLANTSTGWRAATLHGIESIPEAAAGPNPAAALGEARDAMPVPGERVRRSPPIRRLQREALRHQGLGPERLALLERRAERAGWVPELRAGFDLGRSRDHDRDLDRAFTSGALRELLDSSRGRSSDVGFQVDLIWDLTRLYDPDDALAVSRERRLVVQLRDQVLEQVNRLYFERLRIAARLGRVPVEERAELSLRALEIEARLDAWTGGAFSDLLEPASHP